MSAARRVVAGLFALGSLVFAQIGTAMACEPCHEKAWDLPRTVRKAELIIVGRRVGPEAGVIGTPSQPGPETIPVDVVRVLKGRDDRKEITVDSWHGMCDYGIVVDDRPYVMLLTRALSQGREAEYGPVNLGCAVKTLAMTDEGVEVDGKRFTLEEFQALLRTYDSTDAEQLDGERYQ